MNQHPKTKKPKTSFAFRIIQSSKKLVSNTLRKLILWLEAQYRKLEEKSFKDLPYNSLSPIDNADIQNDYQKSLDWALYNRKKLDIKNIALTGPYGSGKSSILKTYMLGHKVEKLQFLNISLATFKEELEEELKSSKEDLLRLIELSILQQIFYQEKDSKIPDSRFKKIKNYTPTTLWLTTICLFVFISAIIFFKYPELINKWVNIETSTKLYRILSFISFAVIVLGSLLIVKKLVRSISSVRINKVNIQSAEIDIADSISKSILNHHIDEILYFFEVTKYNVVIIEDLDRFKQTEIFTKLREINLLLNKSKKINRQIVFIYAVRDDIFLEENERTKFFDFIIPVIPIINPSNSSEKLLEKQTINQYRVSENLIDTLSLFIDDMRLLNNVYNEFYLYQQKLSKKLNQDKLLAIIVYKNIFPNDFTQLYNNKGNLYEALNSKRIYIQNEIDLTDKKIKEHKQNINELDKLAIRNVRELRTLYLTKYISKIHSFNSFLVNEEVTSLWDMTLENNFQYLINNKAYYRSGNGSSYRSFVTDKFIEIEKEVDREKAYALRMEEIDQWNNGKVEFLKQEIEELEKNKLEIRAYKIKELLQKNKIGINNENGKQRTLVNVLLINGFIEEDYFDYISIFYEGSLSKNDNEFRYNVKNQYQTDFNFKLNKIENLLKRINLVDFKKGYCLNFDLLDFIVDKREYKEYVANIFLKLSDESEVSILFIDKYLSYTKHVSNFSLKLVESWKNIWSFIQNKSTFTFDKKDFYFNLIIAHANIMDIQRLYEDSSFKSFLLGKNYFLIITSDKTRIKLLIETLNIKFKFLQVGQSDEELIDFIYQGNFYEINLAMIELILKLNYKFNAIDFLEKNYSSILKSECQMLINYIDKNPNAYVLNIYLALENNKHDDEQNIIKLLNHERLESDKKMEIINKVETLITDISSINEYDIIDSLFENLKIVPNWGNVVRHYELHEKTLTEIAITFLNNDNVANALSKLTIPRDVEKEEKYTSFVKTIILCNNIKDENYRLLIKSSPYDFADLDFAHLSDKKVAILIEEEILTFNEKNFSLLKENFEKLHIELFEKKKSDFLAVLPELSLDSEDVFLLMNSSILSIEEKNILVDNLQDELISSNGNTINIIGEIILANKSFRVNNYLLSMVLANESLSNTSRIKLLNIKHTQVTNTDIDNFLSSLEEPYSDITIKGKRPVLEDNENNLKLAEILVSKAYISKFEKDKKGIRIFTFRNK